MSPSLRKSVPPHFGQAAPGGSELLDRLREPGVGPFLAEEVAEVADGLGRQELRRRRPSQPRAGIGTPQDRWRLMHQSGRSETIASIRDLPQPGSQRHLVDRLERPPAQVVAVDADEPLLGRPEDHRLLAPPAVRIAVRERELVEEVPRLAEHRDDLRVRREDLLAHQRRRGLVGEPARGVDRAEGRQAVGLAGLVVLGPVAGGGVDQAGAVLDADVMRPGRSG